MDDDALRTIGELARTTGLSVKTIRFWSDAGVLPPTDRTPAGYRLYGDEALARLGLVRTLRDLGIDIATIRRVLEREVTVAEVAAAHAGALDVQIRTMRLRRAVLRAAAERGSTPEEMELMHNLANLSEHERRRLIGEFIDGIFEGLDVGPELRDRMRAGMPGFPPDPTPEQVDAWVELAELVQDEEFRAALRRALAGRAGARDEGAPDPARQLDSAAAERCASLVRERVAEARAAGIEPDSPHARRYVDELAGAYAELAGRTDGPQFRSWLLRRLEGGHDPRFERYWQLIAVLDGRPAAPDASAATTWLAAALRAS